MIYINIDMPNSCSECIFNCSFDYGGCFLHDGVPAHILNLKQRPDWCPLKDESIAIKELISLLADSQKQNHKIMDAYAELAGKKASSRRS